MVVLKTSSHLIARRPSMLFIAQTPQNAPGVRSHCRFRNRGTEYVSEPGMKWMNDSTKRECDRALAPPAAGPVWPRPAPGSCCCPASPAGRARVSKSAHVSRAPARAPPPGLSEHASGVPCRTCTPSVSAAQLCTPAATIGPLSATRLGCRALQSERSARHGAPIASARSRRTWPPRRARVFLLLVISLAQTSL